MGSRLRGNDDYLLQSMISDGFQGTPFRGPNSTDLAASPMLKVGSPD
ncbi:hypothetical protein C8J43_104269 [Sphingomonas sp. PP-CE-1G-424]|nr:hypothetical protein C8J43_104269 [Sphingomonas sp. PP-CE-1G-424]